MTRTSFAAAMLMLACFNNAHAAELSDKLAECAAIQSDAERVACYDALAGGQVQEAAKVEAAVEAEVAVEAAPAVVPAATASQPTAIEETPPPEETFGKPADDLTRESNESAGSEPVEQLTATVTGVRLYKFERVIVTLNNGQEWRQTSASSLRLAVGDKIEIRKGAMGSYRMTEAGGSRAMKVRRAD